MPSISSIKLNIADKLEKDKKYRSNFFRCQAQDSIAMSIKELRKKRGKRQIDLAKESNMKQSAISRIEQANYSGWSLNILFRVADALDARLRVSFEPVEEVINWYRAKEAVVAQEVVQLPKSPSSDVFNKVINIKGGLLAKSDAKDSKMERITLVKEIQTAHMQPNIINTGENFYA